MCGRIRKYTHDLYPGDTMNFITKNGIANGRFGIDRGGDVQYNVRNEALRTTWKGYLQNRGVLLIDGFYENDTYFHYADGKEIALPIVFNRDYDFMLITRPAKEVVVTVHNREPMMIEDYNEWIDNQMFTIPKHTLIKQTLQ